MAGRSAAGSTAQPAAKGVSLRVSAAFGARCGAPLRDDGGVQLRDGALFADLRGHCLVQPVGRHLAFRHLETGSTSLAQESSRVLVVTALAVSKDRARLAVCERCSSEPRTQISVYDISSGGSSRPVQTLEEIGEGVGWLVCAAFSGDSADDKLCVASDVPNPQLVVLDWRANSILGRISLGGAPRQIAYSALSGMVSVSSPTSFGVWTFAEGELSPFGEFDDLHERRLSYTDHAWVEPLDGTLLLSTTDGSVLHLNVQSGTVLAELKDLFENSGDQLPEDEQNAEGVCDVRAASRIRCFRGGFVVGGEGGVVSIWEIISLPEDEAEEGCAKFVFHRTCVTRVRTTSASIISIDVSGDEGEHNFAFGFDDMQIGYVSMENLLHGEAACSLLCGGFHSAPVTELGIATYRPIVVSLCHADCSLRVWNFMANRCEFVQEHLGEEPMGLAVHPLGFFVAICFADKLRLFQILASELEPTRELPIKSAKAPCFSNGGHYLAVIVAKQVMVFQTHTLAKVAVLKAHLHAITAIAFDPDDYTLTMLGEDGTLVEWSTKTWTKRPDCPPQAVAEGVAVAAATKGRTWCSVVEGPRKYIRCYRDCARLEQNDFELPDNSEMAAVRACHSPAAPVSATGTITLPVPALLVASTSGSVWLCRDPTTKLTFEEYATHVGACTATCMSGDGRTFATAGEDGSIFVFDVVAASARASSGVVSSVMVNRGELLAGLEEYRQQSERNASLHAQLAEETEKLEAMCRDEVERVKQEDREEIRKLRQRYGSLQQAATTKERVHIRAMKAMEASNLQAMDQLEQSYDKKIRQEAERYSKLVAEKTKLECTRQSAAEEIDRQKELRQQRQHLELTKRLAEKDAEISKLKDLTKFTQHRFDTMLDQEGMENDLALNDLQRECQAELEQQRAVEYKLKKEQDTIIRSLENLEKERERAAQEMDDVQGTKSVVSKQIDELSQQMGALKDERREREKTLREKESEIGTFKGKVNTLNKFKHVLDYSLREVQLSLQPKDRMIATLNEQLRDVEKDFEVLLADHRATEAVLEEKTGDLSVLADENTRLRQEITKREKQIGRFTEDMLSLVDEEPNIRTWPKAIMKVYKAHVPTDRTGTELDAFAMEERQRQIGFLEAKVTQLSSSDKKTEVLCKANIREKTHENSLLIQELNELRTGQKTLQREAKDLELQVRQAEHRMNVEKEARDMARALSASPSVENLDATGPGSTMGHLFRPTASDWTQRAQPQTAASIVAQVRASGSTGSSKRKALEEQKRVQQILLEADKVERSLEVGALENKILRDQVDKLMRTAQLRDGREE